MKVKLLLEYDGAYFRGWQRQEGQVSVQQHLEDALATFLVSQAKKTGTAEPAAPFISGSGRTDAGVHARGQVASFVWPDTLEFDPGRLLLALNGITPHELSVLEATIVPDSFDARHSPHRKQYSYHFLLRDEGDSIYRGRAYRVGRKLNLAEMIRATRYFVGTHDFSSFRSTNCNAKSTVRSILASELTRVDDQLAIFSIQGKGFLKQMVRIMAGTLVRIGRGNMAADEIPKLLEAKDRTQAGDTAPACGLFLDWVRYEHQAEPLESNETEEEEDQ